MFYKFDLKLFGCHFGFCQTLLCRVYICVNRKRKKLSTFWHLFYINHVFVPTSNFSLLDLRVVVTCAIRVR